MKTRNPKHFACGRLALVVILTGFQMQTALGGSVRVDYVFDSGPDSPRDAIKNCPYGGRIVFNVSAGGDGGTCNKGHYWVSGTIGHPDAGTLSGGQHSLAGGSWGVIGAVQTPGAPLLTITATAANLLILAWRSPSPGCALEQKDSLGAGNWTSVGQSPTDNGTTKSVTVSAGPGNKFYRLKK
jgi:hypothetical protein